MKTYLNLLFATIICLSSQGVYAQFPTDMPYQGIPTPNNVPFPNLGESIIDNSVPDPIEITRITEYQAQWDWYPIHEYSKTQVWNIDQTRYKTVSWKIYNAATYQEEQELSGMYPSYWSNTDPDIVWSFRGDGEIKKYNVATNTTQTVANIAGYEFVKLGPSEGNMDKNDHYVALVGKKANGDLDVIVFDMQTNQITTTKTFANAWVNGGENYPDYIDWVSISQSGDYVVVLWSNAWNETVGFYTDQDNVDHYGLEVYNREDMQYLHRIDDSAGHGDLGYAVDGDEVFVQFKTGESGVYMYKLNGIGGEIIVNSSSDFFATGHVSCRNINRPGWAYVTQTKLFSNGQIVAVKLDNTNTVEHFGHHFSTDGSYDQSPMAVASPNGDMVCFKSDFGTGINDGDVAYDFIAKRKLDVTLVLKTILEGPYDAGNQLMTDQLRIGGDIPLIEPYTELGFNHVMGGGEVIDQAVLDVAGNDAIVDWIFVELRDGNNANNILATQSALLQRDGDIVGVDGVSAILFQDIAVDNVIVVLRHRNHLGVRALDLYPTSQNIVIDFSNPATNIFGLAPLVDVDGGVKALIAGDSNGDGQINAVDKNNYWRVENGNPYNYINTKSDFNLDGIANPIDLNGYWRVNNSSIEQLD